MAYDQTAADALREATDARERIAAVLADLEQIDPESQPVSTHNPFCWRWHAGCLAARIRRTLTEGDHHAA